MSLRNDRSFSSGDYEPKAGELPPFLLRIRLAAWVLACGSHGCRTAFAAIVANDVNHVDHDCQVSDQQSAAQPGDSPHEFADLEGQEQGSGNQGHPLGPVAGLPQAVGLGEAERGIGEGDAGRGPEAGVGHVVGKVEKELGRTAIGADAQDGEQTLGVEPDIFVNQGKSTQSHQHHKTALKELEHGYSPEHATLTAVGIWLGSRLAHVDGQGLKAGYHEEDRTYRASLPMPVVDAVLTSVTGDVAGRM